MRIQRTLTSKRLLTYVTLAVATLTILVLAIANTWRHTPTAKAAPALSFELYATHPYASQSGLELGKGSEVPCTEAFCPAGQDIHDMAITDDGQLIAGYGDWNRNADSHGVTAGRVGIVPLNLADATWGTMFYAGTESIDNIRKINGHLYIPTTDPSIKLATGNSTYNTSGYITNDTGVWRYVSNGTPVATHVFDIATLNDTDLWTVGSASFGPSDDSVAFARRSTDGGMSWEEMRHTSGVDLNRHYWLATLNGKIYMRSSDSAETTAVSFDGTTWQNEPGMACDAYRYGTYARIATFDNHIVCASNANRHVQTFNGTTTQQTQFTQTYGYMKDMYIYDGYLYILHSQGISRTNSLSGTWEDLSVALPPGAQSIAVHDDDIYIGGVNGYIYKSTTELQEAEPLTVPDDSCFTFNAGTKTITGYSNDIVACPRAIIIPGEIGGVVVENIGSGAFSNKGLVAVILPGSLVHIGASAFTYNHLQSIIIPDSVVTIDPAAFSQNQLTSLHIGSGVEVITNDVFNSNHLQSIIIPDTVLTIGNSAFARNAISSLQIGESVISIGFDAFSDNSLQHVTIPHSVASIESMAFYNNQLTVVTIPSSVTNLGYWAFGNNPMKSLTIGLPVITGGMFAGHGLTEIRLLDTVTAIAGGAFNNNQITSLDLGGSIVTIGAGSFVANYLTHVVVPGSVTTIEVGAFNTNNLQTLRIDGSPTIGNSALGRNGLDRTTIPSGLTSAQLYEYYQTHTNLVRITATSPDFVAANNDTLYTEAVGGVTYATSGYLINPASVTITYRSKDGSDLTTQQTLIGSDPSLQTYQLANYLDLSDPDNPVFDQAKLATLYRIGDTITITPPEIDGYITPQPFTITLASGEMAHNVVYTSHEEQALLDKEAEQQNSPSDLLGKLASSGMNVWLVAVSGVVLIGGAVYMWCTRYI